MRVSTFVILLCAVLAGGRIAAAQAMGQTVVLTQQTMQSVGDAHGQPIQVIHSTPRPRPQTAGNDEPGLADEYARPHDFPDCGCTKPPSFLVNSGYLPAGSLITISRPSENAVIYYTTDGWTPTEGSPRYTGPITINNDTRLQAFAEESGKVPSPIAEVTFTIRGPQAPKPRAVLADDGILHQGTPLRLITAADVTSDSAQPGDTMVLFLDESVMVGGAVAVRKGSRANATITSVDRAGRGGKPGALTFQVKSLDAHGVSIPLNAKLTMSAPNLAPQSQVSDPSQVQIVGAVSRGVEAEIAPGMPLTATVAADTALHP